jgi:hypothetical protein
MKRQGRVRDRWLADGELGWRGSKPPSPKVAVSNNGPFPAILQAPSVSPDQRGMR